MHTTPAIRREDDVQAEYVVAVSTLALGTKHEERLLLDRGLTVLWMCTKVVLKESRRRTPTIAQAMSRTRTDTKLYDT